MKKILTVIIFAVLSCSVFAEGYVLNTKTEEDGSVSVSNKKGLVQDRIRITNNTDSDIEVIVMGEHKNNGVRKVASGRVQARDSEFISCRYEDDLDDFKVFTISLDKGAILSFNAESQRDDLYFTINKTAGETTASTGITIADVEELLKWKELLDTGVISEADFNDKKKKVLGL